MKRILIYIIAIVLILVLLILLVKRLTRPKAYNESKGRLQD